MVSLREPLRTWGVWGFPQSDICRVVPRKEFDCNLPSWHNANWRDRGSGLFYQESKPKLTVFGPSAAGLPNVGSLFGLLIRSRTRLLFPFPRSTRFLVNVRVGSPKAYGFHSDSFEVYFCMSSMSFFGSTSAEVRPDEGPRTLLRSCTSRWKGSTGLAGVLEDDEDAVTGIIAMYGGKWA